jgi:hypothetical protein
MVAEREGRGYWKQVEGEDGEIVAVYMPWERSQARVAVYYEFCRARENTSVKEARRFLTLAGDTFTEKVRRLDIKRGKRKTSSE